MPRRRRAPNKWWQPSNRIWLRARSVFVSTSGSRPPPSASRGRRSTRKQQRVYYGADGKLTKLPIGEPPAAGRAGGGGPAAAGRLKEKIVENKKDDMQEYMEQAASLIQMYVPPTPAQIQQAKDAGNMALRPQPQGRCASSFQDFVQPVGSAGD